MPFLFLANIIISTLVKPVQLFYFWFANLLLTGFKDTYHVDSDLKLFLNITKSWGSLFFIFFSFYYLTKICFIWLTIFDHIKFGKKTVLNGTSHLRKFSIAAIFFSFLVEIFFFLFFGQQLFQDNTFSARNVNLLHFKRLLRSFFCYFILVLKCL
jgi:hypothetical protein